MSGWKEGLDRRTRGLVRIAERQGWEVTVNHSSHVVYRSPSGAKIIGNGPGRTLDQHHRRTVKRLAREGLDV